MGIKDRAIATYKKQAERQASERATQEAKDAARKKESLIEDFVRIFNVYPEKATAELITHEGMEFERSSHGYQHLSYRPTLGYSDCKCPGSSQSFPDLNSFGRILSREKEPHGSYCPDRPDAPTEEAQQVIETTEQRLIRTFREWLYENTYQG